jgi:hypothetical protein
MLGHFLDTFRIPIQSTSADSIESQIADYRSLAAQPLLVIEQPFFARQSNIEAPVRLNALFAVLCITMEGSGKCYPYYERL